MDVTGPSALRVMFLKGGGMCSLMWFYTIDLPHYRCSYLGRTLFLDIFVACIYHHLCIRWHLF